jgi:hypothetical protein
MILKKPALGLDPRVETVFGKDHAPLSNQSGMAIGTKIIPL